MHFVCELRGSRPPWTRSLDSRVRGNDRDVVSKCRSALGLIYKPAGPDYLCVHTGLRFSINDANPSLGSSPDINSFR